MNSPVAAHTMGNSLICLAVDDQPDTESGPVKGSPPLYLKLFRLPEVPKLI